jgi:RecA-family ATPase
MQLQVGLPLVSFQEVMTQDLTPVDWLVTDLIANQDRVVLYGEPGAMKSWLLLHLAVHIAAGRKWLGQFDVPIAKKVLYIDEEMNVRTLRRRIKRIGDGAALGTKDLPLRLLSLHGVRFDEKGAQTLLDGLAESGFNPDVIIVETLRRVMEGSENDAEDVATFWRNLEPLRKAGKTIIISHHMICGSFRIRGSMIHSTVRVDQLTSSLVPILPLPSPR